MFTTWNNTPGHPAAGSPTYGHVSGIDQNDQTLIFKTPPGKVLPYSKMPKATMKVVTGGVGQAVTLPLAPVSSTVMAPLAPPAPAAAVAKPTPAKTKLTTPRSATASQAKATSATHAAASPTPRTKIASK